MGNITFKRLQKSEYSSFSNEAITIFSIAVAETFGETMDNDNDIEMLQMSGIGVAMGNAIPEVLDIADYVTVSNDEEGAAKAIEKFVLSPQNQ